MKKTKQEKGITLIALIITIVVLLILAVVAINSITNDGIISKAESAANKYNESLQNEATQLQNYLDYLNEHSGTKTYTAYTTGQEVKLKDQSKETGTFYVIEDSDQTKETVLLLTKLCIDTDDLVQSSSAKNIAFSETAYWHSEDIPAYSDGLYKEPFNVIETGEPDASHYAARAAYDYGKNIGAGNTGKILTKDEVNDLYLTHLAVACGTEYGTDGGLVYWTSSAIGDAPGGSGDFSYLYTFDGTSGAYGVNAWIEKRGVINTSGVRPCVEISKDLIELVTEL